MDQSKDDYGDKEFWMRPTELIVHGDLTFQEMLGVCIVVNQVKTYLTGEQTKSITQELDEEVVYDEEYDLSIDNTFKHQEVQYVVREDTGYVLRSEAYSAIDVFYQKSAVEYIKSDLERRFPREEFKDDLPFGRTLDVLLNEHITRAINQLPYLPPEMMS